MSRESHIPKLTDNTIPLQKRFEEFVLWSTSNPCGVIDRLAEQLSVAPGVVEVFYELGNLDEKEFEIIDEKKIDIDSLFLVVRCNKAIREMIYENAGRLMRDRPITAIREFIEEHSVPNFNPLIQSISANVWGKTAQYLKALNIEDGTINKNFRSMLVRANIIKKGGKEISEKMVNWIVSGIVHDLESELGIFTNENIKNNFPKDFVVIEKIIFLINAYSND